ncbi:hypothetical protein Gpo141_00003308 [Globisporangium polare]
MPLTPRFTWEQDAASLALAVALPGGALRNADIYVSDLVVKVNSAPYVLLLDLFALVDAASAAVVKAQDGTLRLTLQKHEPGVWPTLTFEVSKAELKERRQASMDRKVQFEEALVEKRKDKRYQEEKQTLRAQMAVDDANRQILTDLKAEEKQREERAMYESFRELQQKAAEQKPERQATKVPSSDKKAGKPKKKVSFASGLEQTRPKEKQTLEEPVVLELSEDGSFDLPSKPSATPESKVPSTSEALVSGRGEEPGGCDDDDEADAQEPSGAADQVQEALETPSPRKLQPKITHVAAPHKVKTIPAPREPLQSEIQFTPRAFPTPSRESKAAEEEDWLLKNRKHLNKHKGLRGSGAYDISESDPMWLKAKGDDFYRSRDYQSALNAYSEAISLAPEQSDLKITCLSNRAATHLQLADFEACIADCSQALSYIPDTRASNDNPSQDGDSTGGGSSMLVHYRLRLKLFVRRGTAYCRVAKFTEAKADYGVALSMDNQNPTLQDDFLQLVAVEKAQELKDLGDACFRGSKQLEKAVTHYTDSLRLNPLSIACLSNRAACFLVRNEFAKCVQDCTRALELLQRRDMGENEGEGGQHGLAFFSVGPAPGSLKRRAWVLKTLVRRGTAYSAMEEWAKAEADYAASAELDPTNEALRNDLLQVQRENAKALGSNSSPVALAKSASDHRQTQQSSVENSKVASAC